jgi:hypothetical protein
LWDKQFSRLGGIKLMSDSIDWDSFGHCVVCHKNMAFKQVIGMKETYRFSPDYCEGEYLLSDISKMKVALCKQCKENLTSDDYVKIMDCVVRGWQQELDRSNWSEEKKKTYMDRYSKLVILCDAEDKSKDYLLNKYQEYKDAND